MRRRLGPVVASGDRDAAVRDDASVELSGHYRAFKWLPWRCLPTWERRCWQKPDWLQVAKDTFVPSVQWSVGGLTTLVAILGSAISPYIFFWQTAQMVEDERILGRTTVRNAAAPRPMN